MTAMVRQISGPIYLQSKKSNLMVLTTSAQKTQHQPPQGAINQHKPQRVAIDQHWPQHEVINQHWPSQEAKQLPWEGISSCINQDTGSSTKYHHPKKKAIDLHNRNGLLIISGHPKGSLISTDHTKGIPPLVRAIIQRRPMQRAINHMKGSQTSITTDKTISQRQDHQPKTRPSITNRTSTTNRTINHKLDHQPASSPTIDKRKVPVSFKQMEGPETTINQCEGSSTNVRGQRPTKGVTEQRKSQLTNVNSCEGLLTTTNHQNRPLTGICHKNVIYHRKGP
jgi:hypothetical protein